MSDLISRQRVIKEIDRFIPADPMKSDYTQGISVGLAIATRCVEQFSQENHDSSQGLVKDLISRQDAIRWIKAECNPYGKPTLDYKTSCRIMEHLDRMPSAEPDSQPTCNNLATDTISRQAAIDAVNKIAPVNTEYDCTLIDILDVRYVLTELPSAEPEIIKCKDCKHYLSGVIW